MEDKTIISAESELRDEALDEVTGGSGTGPWDRIRRKDNACPKCRAMLTGNEKVCPMCGYPFD